MRISDWSSDVCSSDLIAGLLDPDRVAGVGQGPRREVERLLRAGNDDHLLRRAGDGPRRAEIGGYRLAQRPIAAGIAGHEEAPRRPPPDRKSTRLNSSH